MRECPDCEVALYRGKCRKCGWQPEVVTSRPKVKLIKDCSWRGGKEPCKNLATIYPLTFNPNAEGLCGQHWRMGQEITIPADDGTAKRAMAEIRRILAKSPMMSKVAPVVVDENAGW